MTAAELTTYASIIVTNVGGLITLYFKNKNAANARAQQLVDELAKQVYDLKNHQDISVQKLNGMLSYVIHSFPTPAWLKVARVNGDGRTEFRMLEVNESYAAAYGMERLNYIGKTDLEAGWPLAIANQFQRHDLMVWASGEPTTFTEEVGGKIIQFRKIRVQTRDGRLVGIMGYAFECHDPLNCKKLLKITVPKPEPEAQPADHSPSI